MTVLAWIVVGAALWVVGALGAALLVGGMIVRAQAPAAGPIEVGVPGPLAQSLPGLLDARRPAPRVGCVSRNRAAGRGKR